MEQQEHLPQVELVVEEEIILQNLEQEQLTQVVVEQEIKLQQVDQV